MSQTFFAVTAVKTSNFTSDFNVGVVVWSARGTHVAVNLAFLDRIRYYFIQVALQLPSRG
jgi:hypothetical protein